MPPKDPATSLKAERCGGFPELGAPFGGPNNKDYSIWGSILGPLILGNYHVSEDERDTFRVYLPLWFSIYIYTLYK